MSPNQTLHGYLCIIGAVLIHLTLGTFYVFGNFLPYIASYMAYKNGDNKCEYDKYSASCIWIYTSMGIGQSTGMSIGGKLEIIIGPKLTVFIGCFISSLCIGLTYFTVSNLYLCILTYGLIRGFGVGLAYTTPMVVGMRFYPLNKGLINGIIICAFGLSSVIFDIVITQLINPNDIPQDPDYGFMKSSQVLNKIPSCFIKLGCIYFSIQLIGCLLISNPKNWKYHHDINKEKKLLNEAQHKINENPTGLNIEKEIEKEHNKDLTEFEVVKDMRFWRLFITFFLNSLCLNCFATQWKDFSNEKLYIKNDTLLSIMGSISSLFNGLGRLFWSSLMDYNKSYKLTMGIMTFIVSFLLFTWPLLSYLNDISHTLVVICGFIWLCGLFFSISGSFSVFPTEITNIFGVKRNGIIYGLLFISILPSSFLSAFGIIQIRENFGWFWTSFSFGLCGFCAFIITLKQ